MMYGQQYRETPINELEVALDPESVADYIVFNQEHFRWAASLRLALSSSAVRERLDGFYMLGSRMDVFKTVMRELSITDLSLARGGRVTYERP